MFKKKAKKAEAEAEAPEAAAPAETGEEGVEESPAKKKLPLKLIIIGVAALAVVGGGGGAGYVFFLKPKPAEHAEAGAHGEAKDGHDAKAKAKPKKKAKGGDHGGGGGKADPEAGKVSEGPDGITYYTMPDVIVNMQTLDGRPTFLKLKLTFEFADAHDADLMDPNMPRLQDMFTTFLRELRPEDLAGSQGSYTLRQEIQRRVNLVIAPAKVERVNIEEILIN